MDHITAIWYDWYDMDHIICGYYRWRNYIGVHLENNRAPRSVIKCDIQMFLQYLNLLHSFPQFIIAQNLTQVLSGFTIDHTWWSNNLKNDLEMISTLILTYASEDDSNNSGRCSHLILLTLIWHWVT